MSWVDAIGVTAAVVGASMSAPQLFSILRTRKTDGISLASWQITAGVVLSWLVHGLLADSMTLILANLVMSVLSLIIIWHVANDRGVGTICRWRPVLAIAASCSMIDVTFGSTIYGMAVLIPSAVGILAQMRDLIRSPDVSGVSAVFLIINGTNLFLWALWGHLIGDPALVISGSINGMLGATNLVIYLYRTAMARTLAARVPVAV